MTDTIADLNIDVLETLLRMAANAHHKYEATLSAPDPNWQRWYAQFIYDTVHPTAQAVDAELAEAR